MTNGTFTALLLTLAAILAGIVGVLSGDRTDARANPAQRVRWVNGSTDRRRIYPGIEAAYRVNPQRVEYALALDAGISPEAIVMAFDAADRVEVERHTGDLLLTANRRRARVPRPMAFQLIDGTRVPVEARFIVGAGGHVRYHLGAIDPRARLFIH